LSCSDNSEFFVVVSQHRLRSSHPSPVIAKVSRYPLAIPHLADPLFGALRVLAGTDSGFAPVGFQTSGTHGYQTLRHWGVDGEIARCNTWPTVVQVRVRPTAGGCAVVRNHHSLPAPFSGHFGFLAGTGSGFTRVGGAEWRGFGCGCLASCSFIYTSISERRTT